MENVLAILLAGGLGERLFPLTRETAKPGVPFGGVYRIIDFTLSNCINSHARPKLTAASIETHIEVTSQDQNSVDRILHVAVRPWKGSTNSVGENEESVRFAPGLNRLDLHVDIRDAHGWSIEDPYLYVAEISIREGQRARNEATARFGLREFTVKDGFFHLNGKRIFVKSGHHQGTYPTTLVYPPTREFAFKEVQIFKEAGFNFCRLWQKPTPNPFLDAADELGLLLQEEPPLSLMVDSPYLLERSLREVREMVRRDRNRPSIVVWNMINENDPPVRYVRRYCQVARELDPTRLITESAGGPSRFYLPYSTQGVSYLTEHPYPGAPIAEDVYDYQSTRGVAGQLCFFSEYGYGGMNDMDAVMAHYGDHPRVHMEDYRSHALLKQVRDKAFAESEVLKQVFGDIDKLRADCQRLQAETVLWHTEAMRSNPVCGGYNYVQVFDSNAIEIDGLVDFWRDLRKKSFNAMKEVNQPLLLMIRCRPMNVRSGEEVGVKVTLVNEDKIRGEKRLTVRVSSPSGAEVFNHEKQVEARAWVTEVFNEPVKAHGETGRYRVEAVLWEGGTAVVKKEDYYTMFGEADLSWPREGLAVFDVEGKLQTFLGKRGVSFARLGHAVEEPRVIVVTPFAELWRRPEEFETFIRLFSAIERGCAAVFLGLPENGASLVTAGPISAITFFTPLAASTIFPFHELDAAPQIWQEQRIGAYAWGLTDPRAGVPIPNHEVFKGMPSGMMGREFGNVVPVHRISTDWLTSESTGTTVQIYDHGKGKIILTSLNLLPALHRDALAEKLLCNLVNYATKGLPPKLGPENPETIEGLRFELQGYQDCLRKYITSPNTKKS